MGLLGFCTPTLLTSLNQIIGVLNPKTPHQSQSDYWGTAPQTSSPVSMGLLWCCTPKLITSLSNLIIRLNTIIGLLYLNHHHQSQSAYSRDSSQNYYSYS